ncbi:unnamed protein product [Ascophyllum nodosum]
MRQDTVVRGGQHKNGGILCTAHQTTKRRRRVDGERSWPTPLREGNHRRRNSEWLQTRLFGKDESAALLVARCCCQERGLIFILSPPRY